MAHPIRRNVLCRSSADARKPTPTKPMIIIVHVEGSAQIKFLGQRLLPNSLQRASGISPLGDFLRAGHANASITRSIGGCALFSTLIQSFDRPP
jgi:hypothetical protein